MDCLSKACVVLVLYYQMPTLEPFLPSPAVSPSKPSGCYLAPEKGPCEALMPSYYYSHATDRCEKFYYGGCGGNFNRFRTLEECLQTCGGLAPNGEMIKLRNHRKSVAVVS